MAKRMLDCVASDFAHFTKEGKMHGGGLLSEGGEKIMAHSITIRGVRHTYHRMASSINR